MRPRLYVIFETRKRRAQMNWNRVIGLAIGAVVLIVVARCNDVGASEVIELPIPWMEEMPDMWSRDVIQDNRLITLTYGQHDGSDYFGITYYSCPSIVSKSPQMFKVAWKNKETHGMALGCGGENAQYPVMDLRRLFRELPRPVTPLTPRLFRGTQIIRLT